MQLFRAIRIIGTVVVLAWGIVTLEGIVSRGNQHNPYETPTPPYVSVTASTAHPAGWNQIMDYVSSEIIGFWRFGG